jgi:hypothetical protein
MLAACTRASRGRRAARSQWRGRRGRAGPMSRMRQCVQVAWVWAWATCVVPVPGTTWLWQWGRSGAGHAQTSKLKEKTGCRASWQGTTGGDAEEKKRNRGPWRLVVEARWMGYGCRWAMLVTARTSGSYLIISQDPTESSNAKTARVPQVAVHVHVHVRVHPPSWTPQLARHAALQG